MGSYDWVLWKRRVNDADFRFIRSADLPNCGFSSVFMVDEGTADALRTNGDFSGFKGVVHSPMLWIDCDTEEASNAVEAGLSELGLSFEKWTTGNRGAHFGVKRDANPSPLLPEMDKAWVKARFPSADLKLYSHLHLFRCPGERHQKTGRQKERLYVVEGKTLSYSGEELEVKPTQAPETTTLGDAEFGSCLTDDIVMGFSTPQTNGQRNRALAAVAYRFAERGEDQAFTRRWLDHVNMLFSEPKDADELDKIVRYAYQRSGGV